MLASRLLTPTWALNRRGLCDCFRFPAFLSCAAHFGRGGYPAEQHATAALPFLPLPHPASPGRFIVVCRDAVCTVSHRRCVLPMTKTQTRGDEEQEKWMFCPADSTTSSITARATQLVAGLRCDGQAQACALCRGEAPSCSARPAALRVPLCMGSSVAHLHRVYLTCTTE